LTRKIFLAVTSQPKRIGGSVERKIQVNDKALSMKGGRFIIVGLFAFDPWGAWFAFIFTNSRMSLMKAGENNLMYKISGEISNFKHKNKQGY
jgi:hypothetical protein